MKRMVYITGPIVMSVFLIVITSCQQVDDDSEIVESVTPVALKVTTRAANEANINYPVCLYAFSPDGKFVDMQIVESQDASINFKLPIGEYHIVALSGMKEEYITTEKPDMDEIIRIKDKYATSPLMHGMANVTLKGKSSNVIITMAYAVAAVYVNLTNIINADKVKVSLSSIYPYLSLNGQYKGEGEKIDIDCAKDTEGNWGVGPFYIFPGSSTKTIFTITIEKNGETQAYGYTYNGIPQANHPFKVAGSFNGMLSIEGSLLIKNWDDPIEVNFSFGDIIDDKTSEENTSNNKASKEIPQVGSIWNDCIVANIKNVTENSADLLLLSLDEWEGKYSDGELFIEGYAVNGIGKWRLPSDEEAKLLRDTFNGTKLAALNAQIKERKYSEMEISTTYRYLCKKGNLFYSFLFVEGKSVTQAGSKTVYLIRPVKVHRFMIND